MVFAYLDPGSGSLIVQAILGGVASIGVAARAFRVRRRAGKSRPEPDGEVEPAPAEDMDSEPTGQ
jgi:hypothetical protein